MIHALFPLAVGEYRYEGRDAFKQIFLQKMHSYMIPSVDGSYIAGDVTGLTDIHVEPDFENLFRFIADSVRQHFDFLNFRHEFFDLVFTKTWLTILDDNCSTPIHTHETSHYSFVYYINVPENSDLLCFTTQKNPNEPFAGAFFDHGHKNLVRTLIDQYNILNSLEWQVVPEEGKMFLFPSHVPHHSKKIGSVGNQHRISIAGDIFLVYKKELEPNYPTGIFPISQWKTF